MIKIIFKNVGQGDSIILEYLESDQRKIIILDCKKHLGTNPTLEHVIKEGYQTIDLIILSHPHFDHFSGLGELIEYCCAKKIIIKYFIHTANNTPSYWRAAVSTIEADSEILKLFKSVRKAKKEIELKFGAVQGESLLSEFPFGLFKIKILAPTSTELDNYVKKIIDFPYEEEDDNNGNGNWLSTMIKVSYSNWFILLTSDVEKSVFKYYGIKRKNALDGKLILAQSAHHGAFKNHNNSFWKQVKNKDSIPIIFSVGKNKYKHPSKDVVDFFAKEGFDIYFTNEVDYFQPKSTTANSNSKMLDIFSKPVAPVINNKYNGDKKFMIDASGDVTFLS